MKFTFSLGACALLLAALPAMGQETARPIGRDPAPRRATALLNVAITQDGRPLGRVSDMTFGNTGAVQDLIVRTTSGLVVVPYSALRYDSRQRSYTIAARVTPRPLNEVREPVVVEPTPVPTRDPFPRIGRLVRTEPPPPPPPVATLERVPAPVYTPPAWDAASVRRTDFAAAARMYSEPVGGVSLTRNIDRLPRRSAAFDNYTLPSEAAGRRSGFRLPPPPAVDFQGGTSSALGGLFY
jgi:hypothetical protein